MGVAELALMLVGVLVVLGDERAPRTVQYLLMWDGLAGTYLLVGLVIVLPVAPRPPAVAASRVGRLLVSYRFKALSTTVASLIGMSAAVVVVSRQAGGPGPGATGAGVAAIALAWTLLHASYAQLYSILYRRPGGAGGGLIFPGTDEPGQVEFLYFSFTIGTTFAASDVTVTGHDLRWRVMVHSVLSFFYYAVVLAVAFNVLIGP